MTCNYETDRSGGDGDRLAHNLAIADRGASWANDASLSRRVGRWGIEGLRHVILGGRWLSRAQSPDEQGGVDDKRCSADVPVFNDAVCELVTDVKPGRLIQHPLFRNRTPDSEMLNRPMRASIKGPNAGYCPGRWDCSRAYMP